MLPRAIALVTKGMLSQPSLVTTYRVLPMTIDIETINKRLNVRVDEYKTYNILRINNKTLNVTVLNNNVNISSESIKQINIKRS